MYIYYIYNVLINKCINIYTRYNVLCMNIYIHIPPVCTVYLLRPKQAQSTMGNSWWSNTEVIFSRNLEGYGDLKPFTIPEILTFVHDLVVEIG